MTDQEQWDMNDYQSEALKTVIYPDRDDNLTYPVLGLNGEAGELAEKLKKYERDGVEDEAEFRESMADELGDVLWYLAVCADELGYDLEGIARRNVEKLQDRQERGELHGSGDER
jgi:NTP pyrophosphatase (non-canonical NTP hydrolase)